MALVTVNGIAELQALINKPIGPTPWRTVSQEDVNTFARLTGDNQWIHVDVERAKKESPYKQTIAHGNLTLSLIDGFRGELMETRGHKLGVNYGWNKVRFPSPVVVGARVRAGAEVLSLEDVGKGWWQVVTRFTVDVEGAEKPACVAESVVRYLPA